VLEETHEIVELASAVLVLLLTYAEATRVREQRRARRRR
jgi:hypothetical protein